MKARHQRLIGRLLDFHRMNIHRHVDGSDRGTEDEQRYCEQVCGVGVGERG